MTTQRTSPKDRNARVLTYGFLLVFLVYSMTPLGWMLATSFKPEEQTKEYPPRLIPKTVTLENYHRVLTQTMMPRFLLNSLILSGGTMVAVLGLASLAGYGFSRYRFPGKHFIFLAMLASVMISGISVIVPLYVMFLRLGLLNTYWPLLCIYVTQALPISVWLLKAYFDTIPLELDESALIDGCTRIQVLRRVILPTSKPGLVAAALYTFVVVWREFIIAATFVAKENLKTMPVGIYMFFTELGIEWGKLGAASMLVAIPPIILFFTFQRWFNPGAVTGALK
jgi:ABC-type glycerol-3-phosphate transport system permease component